MKETANAPVRAASSRSGGAASDRRSGTNAPLEIGEGKSKHRASVGDLVTDGFELGARRFPETDETFCDRPNFRSEALADNVKVPANLFRGFAVHAPDTYCRES
jgi:hypothetical protein